MKYKIHNDIDNFIENYNHINYCELVIGTKGEIYELLCTSHQDMLSHIVFGKPWWEMTDKEAMVIYSEIGNMDTIEYLCLKSGCCAIWFNKIMIPKNGINEIQYEVIKKLYESKKFKVNITSIKIYNDNIQMI